MTMVFVDTAYWIAISLRDDQWSTAAREARARLGGSQLVTTDEVLAEYLTSLSGAGPYLRAAAARAVRDIVADPNVRVLPQSRESFDRGLRRYEGRLDKGYSLQDCVSMNVMEAEGITEILTSDHNFEQEGFTILIKRNRS